MDQRLVNHVWVGRSALNPVQTYHQGTLSLAGNQLSFNSDSGSGSFEVPRTRVSFPLWMGKAGFVVQIEGKKRYVWFYDPKSSSTLYHSQSSAFLGGGVGLIKGISAAKPWRAAIGS
jgi:hypothetical protein